MPDVRSATAGDVDAVVETLTAAFLDDPFISWIIGDQAADLSRPKRWWSFWFEQALERDQGAFVTQRCEAATLWVRPDVLELDEDGEDRLEELLDGLVGG